MSMKLAILGLLMEGDSYPYEIRQKMKERKLDNYFKIQDGSLYYAIDQLGKTGHVETMEIVRDSNRPDKTIYRITEKGKTKFQQLLIEQMKQKNGNHNPMYIALAFSRHGDEKEITGVIAEKIVECERESELMHAVYHEHIPEVSRGVLHLMWGKYEHLQTELKWLKRLQCDAQSGRLKEIGHPLDLE
ncbi:MAG: transcriptional regulator, PadR-like family [Bacilli bacterium]|nr:transcriptional regulator, PadR-like family [Bacilli bacterium]